MKVSSPRVLSAPKLIVGFKVPERVMTSPAVDPGTELGCQFVLVAQSPLVVPTHAADVQNKELFVSTSKATSVDFFNMIT